MNRTTFNQRVQCAQGDLGQGIVGLIFFSMRDFSGRLIKSVAAGSAIILPETGRSATYICEIRLQRRALSPRLLTAQLPDLLHAQLVARREGGAVARQRGRSWLLPNKRRDKTSQRSLVGRSCSNQRAGDCRCARPLIRTQYTHTMLCENWERFRSH